jgi:hypothetical protein
VLKRPGGPLCLGTELVIFVVNQAIHIEQAKHYLSLGPSSAVRATAKSRCGSLPRGPSRVMAFFSPRYSHSLPRSDPAQPWDLFDTQDNHYLQADPRACPERSEGGRPYIFTVGSGHNSYRTGL